MVSEATMAPVDLAQPLSQEAFGQLVGISQPAVSDMMTRGVIQPGDSAGAWLLAYTAHLREQAAGRGADGELATERARLAREQADAVAMRNAERRKELLPVGLLEAVLAQMARKVSVALESLPPKLKRACPELPPAALQTIATELAVARQATAGLRLDALEQADDEDEVDA